MSFSIFASYSFGFCCFFQFRTKYFKNLKSFSQQHKAKRANESRFMKRNELLQLYLVRKSERLICKIQQLKTLRVKISPPRKLEKPMKKYLKRITKYFKNVRFEKIKRSRKKIPKTPKNFLKAP